MIITNYKELTIPGKIKNSNWEKALSWLKADSWKDVPMGRTEIDGARVFVIRSSYVSKLESGGQYESHRLYADIQMPIKGTELQLACLEDKHKMKISVPYSEEKDIEFFEGEPETDNRLILSFPMVVVYFPWDIHKSNISVGNSPTENERILVKVAL